MREEEEDRIHAKNNLNKEQNLLGVNQTTNIIYHRNPTTPNNNVIPIPQDSLNMQTSHNTQITTTINEPLNIQEFQNNITSQTKTLNNKHKYSHKVSVRYFIEHFNLEVNDLSALLTKGWFSDKTINIFSFSLAIKGFCRNDNNLFISTFFYVTLEGFGKEAVLEFLSLRAIMKYYKKVGYLKGIDESLIGLDMFSKNFHTIVLPRVTLGFSNNRQFC